MTTFLLFGTAGCHLCEQAEQLLADFKLSIEAVDIAEQEVWQDRYAVRIPVLYHPASQRELGWPFDELMVRDFLAQIGSGLTNNPQE